MICTPLSSGLAGSSDTSATLAMEVTARAPVAAELAGTILVPGFSGAKLFLLHTGMPFSISGASVLACSTLAPL